MRKKKSGLDERQEKLVNKIGMRSFMVMFFVCAAVIVAQLAWKKDLSAVAGETVVLLAGGVTCLWGTMKNGIWSKSGRRATVGENLLWSVVMSGIFSVLYAAVLLLRGVWDRGGILSIKYTASTKRFCTYYIQSELYKNRSGWIYFFPERRIFMQDQHLAMASVPAQPWSGQLYEWEQAIKIGTIFPELNLPFFAAESQPGQIPPMAGNNNASKTPEQEEREQLLARLNAVSFALDDVVLFLDTHPQETQAAQLRTRLLEERKALKQTFVEKFYPLTKECEGNWSDGPIPWEGACI